MTDLSKYKKSYAVGRVITAIEFIEPLKIYVPDSYPHHSIMINGIKLNPSGYRETLYVKLKSAKEGLTEMRDIKDRDFQIESIKALSDRIDEIEIETIYDEAYDKWTSVLSDFDKVENTSKRLELEGQAEAHFELDRDIYDVVRARRNSIDDLRKLVNDTMLKIGEEHFDNELAEIRMPQIKRCYNYLVEEEFIEEDRFHDFVSILTGNKPQSPLTWKSKPAHLSAFFHIIAESGKSDIFKKYAHFWANHVLPNFKDAKGNPFDKNNLRNAGHHSKEHPIVKKATDYLVSDS